MGGHGQAAAAGAGLARRMQQQQQARVCSHAFNKPVGHWSSGEEGNWPGGSCRHAAAAHGAPLQAGALPRAPATPAVRPITWELRADQPASTMSWFGRRGGTATPPGPAAGGSAAPGGAGSPLELIRFDSATGKFELGREALQALKNTRGPVGVVAVCGRARQVSSQGGQHDLQLQLRAAAARRRLRKATATPRGTLHRALCCWLGNTCAVCALSTPRRASPSS